MFLVKNFLKILIFKCFLFSMISNSMNMRMGEIDHYERELENYYAQNQNLQNQVNVGHNVNLAGNAQILQAPNNQNNAYNNPRALAHRNLRKLFIFTFVVGIILSFIDKNIKPVEKIDAFLNKSKFYNKKIDPIAKKFIFAAGVIGFYSFIVGIPDALRATRDFYNFLRR